MVQQANTGSGSAETAGDGERVVCQGEDVITVATEVGHLWKTIWDDRQNAELKRRRGSPHVLLPGDRVHIPPIRLRSESGQTQKRHRFVRKGVPIRIQVRILGDGKPLKGEAYVLSIENRAKTGAVPDDGVVEADIYPSDVSGWLEVGEGASRQRYPLALGNLDPAHSPSGAAARLKNLGYLEDDDPDAYEDALRAFQSDNKLSVSGTLDDTTARKLAEAHGS